MAYKLEAEEQFQEALMAHNLLYQNRKEEPQGLRDMALLEAKLGKIDDALLHLNQLIEDSWNPRYR